MAYRSEYCEIAYRHTLAGATMDELSHFLGETPRTVVEWIEDNPEFRDAVQRGCNGADCEIEQSLYRA